MSDKTIYDLKLHEELKIKDDLFVVRVPGGWLYQAYTENEINSVFVPYYVEVKNTHNEPAH